MVQGSISDIDFVLSLFLIVLFGDVVFKKKNKVVGMYSKI